MDEADTRAELIDPQLKEAGWISGGDIRVQREYNINAGEIRVGGVRTGKLKADYVLSFKNRKLAVVEAKSDELDVSEERILYGHKDGGYGTLYWLQPIQVEYEVRDINSALDLVDELEEEVT